MTGVLQKRMVVKMAKNSKPSSILWPRLKIDVKSSKHKDTQRYAVKMPVEETVTCEDGLAKVVVPPVYQTTNNEEESEDNKDSQQVVTSLCHTRTTKTTRQPTSLIIERLSREDA